MKQVCLWWTSWDVSLGLALLARDAPPVSLRASRNWKPPQVEWDASSACCLHFADQSRRECPTSSPLSRRFEEHFNCVEFNFHSFSKFYQIYVQSLPIRENERFHISLEGSRRRECPSVLHCLSLLKPSREHKVPLCEWILAVGDWLELLASTMDSASCSRKETGHKISLLQEPGSRKGRWHFRLCVERQKSLLSKLGIRSHRSLWYSGLHISFCWGPPVKAFSAQVFKNSKLLFLFS